VPSSRPADSFILSIDTFEIPPFTLRSNAAPGRSTWSMISTLWSAASILGQVSSSALTPALMESPMM